MKLTVLASGSGGNATYLETEKTKILIDCGITYRQITQRLKTHDLDVDDLTGVLITHEHTDHIKGLDVTMRRHNATCYLTEDTYNGMYFKTRTNLNTEQLSFITPYESFMIDNVMVTPLSISHDASDAVGYILQVEGKKIVYVTDVGYLPERDHDLLRDADIYIFESNYDVTLLFTSNRPFYLKQRIDSVKGHMSNNDSAYNLAQIIGPNTKKIILAHRSKECNRDDLCISTYQEVFNDYGYRIDDYELEVAKQDIPTKLFHF